MRKVELIEFIGRGAMGAVYKGRQSVYKGEQLVVDRIVAVKVMLPQAADDASIYHRFTREARALGRLNHPNIVRIHEFELAGNFLYFAMDFVNGLSLRQTVKSERLVPSRAVKLFLQLCDGLEHAHQRNVIHRDIKPENLLVDQEDHLKIVDFGLAKLIGGAGASNEWQTLDSRRMGTLGYMALEQVENPQAVDHRADIYAAGVVLYEMLTGKLPLGFDFPRPSQKANVDPSLDEVLFKALEKDLARRYQNIREFKQAVEAVFPSSAPASQKFHQNIDDFQEAVKAVVFTEKEPLQQIDRRDLERQRQGLAKLLRENRRDVHLEELIWKEFKRICDQLNDEEGRVWASLGLARVYQQQRRLAEAALERKKSMSRLPTTWGFRELKEAA